MHPCLLVLVAAQSLFSSTVDPYQHKQIKKNYQSHNEQIPLFSNTFDAAVPSLTWCGGPEDVFVPKSLLLLPDPPQKGQSLQVKLTGYLKEAVVQGATAHVKVKLGFISLLDQDFDVCNEIHQIDKECPVPQGDFVLEKTFDIPAAVPSGHYRIHIETKNANGHPIQCANADFRL